MKPARPCYESKPLNVKLEQTGFDQFTVVYGKQVKTGLSYADATTELGICLMHSLACEGFLDNRTRKEARADGDKEPYTTFTAGYVDAGRRQEAL